MLQPARLQRRGVSVERFAALRPDLGVVAAYGRILPDALLAIPRLGMINVHASLLPRYRGAAPVHRAVIAGDTETGVTIMRVVKELDAGPMFASAAADRAGRDERRGRARPRASSAPLCCSRSSSSWPPARATRRRRTTSAATYAPKIDEGTRGADRLDDAGGARSTTWCAASSPGRSSSARIGGDRACLVHRTELTAETSSAASRPGTVVDAGGDALAVVAGDGSVLRILRDPARRAARDDRRASSSPARASRRARRFAPA